MKQKTEAAVCPNCGGNKWEWCGLNIAAGKDGKGTADQFQCLKCLHVITDDLVIYDSDFVDATEDFIRGDLGNHR